jgi:hypothetical protein
MKLTPVYKCRVCGKPVYVTLLDTTRPDPDGKLLFALMAGLEKVALCNWHQRQKNWYASQNRLGEWDTMAAQAGQLLVVHDPRKDDPEWQRVSGTTSF